MLVEVDDVAGGCSACACAGVEWCRNTEGGAPRAEVAGSRGGGIAEDVADRDGSHWSGVVDVLEACASDDGRYALLSWCAIMMFSERSGPTCSIVDVLVSPVFRG
jgi:hypothetical protein